MATERNLTFQLGETWSIPFDGGVDLTSADIDLDIALGETLALSLASGVMSPDPFALNSPAVDGIVTVAPGDQTTFAPETYLYEVRATLADGTVVVCQFGRIIVGASLFAWPEPSL